MEPIIVGAFPKNRTEIVAGEISEFNDVVSAHVRVFKSTVDGGLAHTSKGVALPIACVPALRDAVHALRDVIGPNRITGRIDVGRQQIRVGTVLFNDQMYLDIRRYYESDGKWCPTPKGVMVRPELLDDLTKLVDELAASAGSLDDI